MIIDLTFPHNNTILLNTSSSINSFEDALSAASLPPPGPSYYAARRSLWLSPRSRRKNSSPQSPEPSTSRQKLESLLRDGVDSEDAWKGGLEKVWKGLIAGGRLKRRLPLGIVLKVIHAGWLHDLETWPPGAVAPESDDVLEVEEASALVQVYPASVDVQTECSSGITSPWTAMSGETVVGDFHRASGLVTGR